jgi:hypothetical protein
MSNEQGTAKDRETSPDLSAEEIAEQGSKVDESEVKRQLQRGDESQGNPDERDVAGALEYEETAHGWEEVKHQTQTGDESND